MSGGTFFVIGLGIAGTVLVAVAFGGNGTLTPRRRRLRLYVLLIAFTLVLGVLAAALVAIVDPVGASAPDAHGWTLGGLKWIPVGLAVGVAVCLGLVEVLVTVFGNHIGHPYIGCEVSRCKREALVQSLDLPASR